MTKITELYELRWRTVYETNEDGERESSTEDYDRLRPVKTVSVGIRFGYFLLDTVFFVIFLFLIGIAAALLENLINTPIISALSETQMDWISRLLIYPFYYLIFESLLQSTPAKLIFGFYVIDEYAEKPTFAQLLGRSYGRIVPFNVFSCLSDNNGSGSRSWHDCWASTWVVSKEEKNNLAQMLAEKNAETFSEN
ncbi:MAG: hypothetical protein CFE24_14370 [Flavobacterium sp. BFFFF2]|nr:MAG: hypothetical protein CFE24_14370 [Flavobacterium sp. BFFFF2]